MYCQIKWDQDQGYINSGIKWATSKLIGRFGFTQDDREDLQQDFLLDLLIRLPAYQHSKAGRRTFISRLIRNRLSHIIRHQKAKVRDFSKRRFSLDGEWSNGEETLSGLELLEREEYSNGIYGRTVAKPPDHESRLAFSATLSSLPALHQKVCQHLQHGDQVGETAFDLGIHRATVHRRIPEIRRHLVEAGFGPGASATLSEPLE